MTKTNHNKATSLTEQNENDTILPTSAKESIWIRWQRWFVLAMFVFYSASNAFQWTQLVIITNILEKYYEVKQSSVSWTSMIYMITYIPLIFPATWYLQEQGLRRSVLLGSLGTCLGSWIKVFATNPDQFSLLFTGQTVVAVSQIFILGIPPQLASTWFPSNQVGSACAIGVFGNQLGVALGFVIPASVVKNQQLEVNYHMIGTDLFYMFLAVAILTSILVVSILVGFADRPKVPPSKAEEQRISSAETSNENKSSSKEYFASIKRLLSNINYVILLVTYGINVGVFYAISTLLNTVILAYFENAETDAGRIGLIIVLFGMAGSMISGVVLDKTHAYKATTLIVYLFSFLGMIVYTFTFTVGYIELVYFTASLLGSHHLRTPIRFTVPRSSLFWSFFMTGYLPLGFELAAEITYPESEGTSSGLLNASAQIFGILATLTAGALLRKFPDDRISNGFLSIILLIGTIMTALIKKDYRRQNAAAEHIERDDQEKLENNL